MNLSIRPNDVVQQDSVQYIKLKKYLQSLLINFQNGITLRNFCKVYEDQMQKEIPFKELGYSNIEQFIHSMEDSIDVRYSGGQLILKAKSNSSNSHIHNLVNQQKCNPPSKRKPVPRSYSYRNYERTPLPPRFRPPRYYAPDWNVKQKPQQKKELPAEIRKRLKMLIAKYPSGLQAYEIIKLYYNEYNAAEYQNDLSYRDYGYTSAEELFLSESDIFNIETWDKKTVFFPVTNSSPSFEEAEKDADPENLDMVTTAECYTSVSILDLVEYVGKTPFVHISIGEVYSPYNFWFIAEEDKLDQLTNEIQDFYKGHTLQKWTLQHEHTVLKQPVVSLCKADNLFYRAIITNFKGLELVEVMYVDFGTTCWVPRSELWYLHKKFLNIPTQTFKATLYGIQPVSGVNWKENVSQRFVELVSGKESLFAELINIESFSEQQSVRIIDTENEDTDVCVNDVLVREELAVYKTEETDLHTSLVKKDHPNNMSEMRVGYRDDISSTSVPGMNRSFVDSYYEARLPVSSTNIPMKDHPNNPSEMSVGYRDDISSTSVPGMNRSFVDSYYGARLPVSSTNFPMKDHQRNQSTVNHFVEKVHSVSLPKLNGSIIDTDYPTSLSGHMNKSFINEGNLPNLHKMDGNFIDLNSLPSPPGPHSNITGKSHHGSMPQKDKYIVPNDTQSLSCTMMNDNAVEEAYIDNVSSINQRCSNVNQWLQEISIPPTPPSSGSSLSKDSGVGKGDASILDAMKYLDAACQSLDYKKNSILTQASVDSENNEFYESVIKLNHCIRLIRGLKIILEDFDCYHWADVRRYCTQRSE